MNAHTEHDAAKDRTAVRLSYFLRVPNAGDRANPNLVEALTGEHAKWTDDRSQPHLVASGSVMASATPTSIVWGTGVMHPALGCGSARAGNVYAVRGPLTLAALRETGAPIRDVPLGDPGILAPALMGVARAQARFRCGLVAHYVDRAHPHVQALLREPGVADLDVHAEPLTLLKRMAACEVVLSTSLHGLIFAEALGLPNLWLKASAEIAGEDFKFRDWFATTARPQLAPVVLSGLERLADLISRTELHESQIDASALLAAFPRDRLAELRTSVSDRFVPVDEARARPTPAVLISYNRADMLRNAISGLAAQDKSTQVVVHDNGSTDPAVLALLDELQSQGVKVARRTAIDNADALNQVDETVREVFADWGEPQRYIVSDCDIDLSIAAPEALDVYGELLNRRRKLEAVGPMLRIRDLSLDYPLFNHALNRHIEQFWRHAPELIETSFGPAAVLECLIDTTLALHRAGEPFRRLKRSLRVYEPYEALHLDWYRTAANDDDYTLSSNAAISHWNNLAERERHASAALAFESFIAVFAHPDRSLEVQNVRIRANWPQLAAPAAPDGDPATAAAKTSAT